MLSPAADMPLSGRLRSSTQVLHREAERTRFVQALLGGRLGSNAYVLMLRNLQPIYRALESGLLAHARHPALGSIMTPELFREKALGQDLDALHGAGWESAVALVPSAHAYARRLEMLARTDPALLVAHVYVRYLGDLNGGQLFARVVSRLLEREQRRLTGALRFHDFGTAGDVTRLAGGLRGGLDALEAGDGLAQRIVAEAVHAFERHVTLFDELATACSLTEPALPPVR